MNTIIQRLLAETSPFFKKVQITLVFILGLANALSAFIPAGILPHVNEIGIAIIVFSAFTVHDATALEGGFSLSSVLSIVPDLASQLGEIKDALSGKLSLADAQALLTPAPTAVTTAPAAPVQNIVVNTAPAPDAIQQPGASTVENLTT